MYVVLKTKKKYNRKKSSITAADSNSLLASHAKTAQPRLLSVTHSGVKNVHEFTLRDI